MLIYFFHRLFWCVACKQTETLWIRYYNSPSQLGSLHDDQLGTSSKEWHGS